MRSQRSTLQIRGVTAGGKSILGIKRARRQAPAGNPVDRASGSGRVFGGSRGQPTLFLLDLQTGEESELPSLSQGLFTSSKSRMLGPKGEMVAITNRDEGKWIIRLWDSVTRQIKDGWSVDIETRSGSYRTVPDPEMRRVLYSWSSPPTATDPLTTIYLADPRDSRADHRSLEVEGELIDVALSPSARWEPGRARVLGVVRRVGDHQWCRTRGRGGEPTHVPYRGCGKRLALGRRRSDQYRNHR